MAEDEIAADEFEFMDCKYASFACKLVEVAIGFGGGVGAIPAGGLENGLKFAEEDDDDDCWE